VIPSRALLGFGDSRIPGSWDSRILEVRVWWWWWQDRQTHRVWLVCTPPLGRRSARGREIRGAAAELRRLAVRRQGLGGRGEQRLSLGVGREAARFGREGANEGWRSERPLCGSGGTVKVEPKSGFGSPLTPISDGFGKKGHSWKKSG
jgi:hypothetical protein